MKLFCTILLLAFFPAALVCAQDPVIPVTGQAVYFDVSPPLRNLHGKPSGKVDRSWKEGAVPNIIQAHNIADYPITGARDTVIQFQNGSTVPDTILLNFDGLGNVNNLVPPDPNGAVGPSHYFQLVNLSFAIYDKTGVKLIGPLNTSSIWEGLPHNSNNGDGIVLYDEQASRWLISQFSLPSYPQGPFYEMVAVSQTPDPTGSWYRWEFAFSDMPDYPKFGIWPDGYYLSFTRLKTQTMQRDGVTAMAFDRNAMINGDPAPKSVQFSLTAIESPYTFMPADCDGPFPPAGTPNYFGNTTNGFFVLREFHADWTNPAASTFGNTLKLPVSPYSGISMGGIPQKESDKLLTSLDDRLMYRLQYRKFSDHQAMVVNHTVGVGSHAGIRWYEFRKTNRNWFVNQQSTFSPDTLSRWMGSMAMDSSGNIALGYSVSGTSMFPSIRFTGRMKHDPPGQMTIAETTIIDGTGSQTGIWAQQSRWGDYSSMAIDPSAPSTFWYTQEYYATTSNNSWKTRIASFSFLNILDIHATSAPSQVCAGGSARLDVDVVGGSASTTYLWSSDPPGFASGLKSPWISPIIPATYIVQVTSGSQVKTDSVVVPVIPLPSAYAGNDTAICRYLAELSLTGSVSNCNSLKWFTSGDGYFTQPDALNTLYRFGPNDKSTDSVRLKLTAYPAAPCLPVSAIRIVVFDTCTGLNEQSKSKFMLNLYPNPVRDKLTIGITGMPDHHMNLDISNPIGETIFSATIEHAGAEIMKQIDVSGYSRGLFFVRVRTNSGVAVRPFVVE